MQVKGESTTNQLPNRSSTLNNTRGVPSVTNGIGSAQNEEGGYITSNLPKKKVDSQSRHLGYNSTTVGNASLKHSKTDLNAVVEKANHTGGYLNDPRTNHNSVANSRKQPSRLPPYLKKACTDATESMERLTTHNMSRGQDCGSSTHDIVLTDDMNSSCGTLNQQHEGYHGKPSSIQTYRVSKAGKREVLYSSFQQPGASTEKIAVVNGQIENGYQSNIPSERTKAGGGSFNKTRHKQSMLNSKLPKSRSGARGYKGRDGNDSSHDSFSCLEEDVINEDSSHSGRSSASDNKNQNKQISKSNNEKRTTKIVPYQQSGIEPLSDPRKGTRLRPLAPMSHKSTTGSSSIKSNYSGQYRGNRALNTKQQPNVNAPPNTITNKSTQGEQEPYQNQQSTSSNKQTVSTISQSHSGHQQSVQANHNGRLRTTDAQPRVQGCTPLGTQNAVKGINRAVPLPGDNSKVIKKGASSMNTTAQLTNQIQQRNGGSVGPNGRLQANMPPGGPPPQPGAAQVDLKRGQQQKLLFEKGMFDRPMAGQFMQLFPFNKRTEELAFALNRMASSKASTIGGPNYLKMIVEEIKQFEQAHTAFVKNGRSYHQQPSYAVPQDPTLQQQSTTTKSSVLN